MTAISVLLLCGNHTRFLEDCIGSLARQTETDFEIVFLDNASSDGSFELARDLFDKFGLRATMIGNDRPRSIPANFNRLLKESTGATVAALSTDDWYDEAYVETLAEAVDAHPEAGWFACSGWLYFEAEKRTEPVDDAQFVTDCPVSDAILNGDNPHFFVGCAYRRPALDAVGGWDEGQLIEDRDLFLRLSQRFGLHRIPRRLVHYRRTSMTTSANAGFMIEGWERFFAKHHALFGPRLTGQRAEMYRSHAAVLTDRGRFTEAGRALVRSLRLRPLNSRAWRTAFYLGRRMVGRLSHATKARP